MGSLLPRPIMHPLIRVLPRIAQAIDNGEPVVALESSVFAQGLPCPENAEAARAMLDAVESAGAVPGITAVVRGTASVGLEAAELDRFLQRDGVRKVSARDLATAIASGSDGATTVAGALALASAVGIHVFATGGIGGVHRDAPYDESADLGELARTPMVVVCAGAKSILDLEATWERLETLGVTVIGYRTNELPGFFAADTGIQLDTRVDEARDVAAIWRAHRSLGRRQSVVVVQAPPEQHRLSRQTVEAAADEARAAARRNAVRGSAVTPFLLSEVTRLTSGGSLAANVALLRENAALAGAVAKEIAIELRRPPMVL
jgi:pseudouridylate synthase